MVPAIRPAGSRENMPISIVMADDHPIVRRGMLALFESQPDFSVRAVAGDGLDTVRLTESLKPDVLVLDLMMPGLSGLEVLRIVRDRSPQTRVVILSMYSSSPFIAQALQGGANGYVLKGCSEEDLVCAVREAAAGRRFLSPAVNQTAVSAYIEQSGTGPLDLHETLTERQREVLQLVAEGRTNAEIAARLGISQRTVENHRTALMQRLRLNNHMDLIRYAIRHRLISSED
jgi:DNA-binding NarL/FixJ family response regulator